MSKHPDCEDRCQILEHKGYHTCSQTGRCEQLENATHKEKPMNHKCEKCGTEWDAPVEACPTCPPAPAGLPPEPPAVKLMRIHDPEHALLQAYDTLRALCAAQQKPCEWTEDDDGCWDTGCGNKFFFDSGTPEENGSRFCFYCGHPMAVIKYVDPPIEDDDTDAALAVEERK